MARYRSTNVASTEPAPAMPVSIEFIRATVARTAQLDPDDDALPAVEPARPTGAVPLLEPAIADLFYEFLHEFFYSAVHGQ